MIKLSRFAHVFELDGAVALFHSLRMKPVYLSKNAYESLQEWLASSFCSSFDAVPESICEEVHQLKKCKILTSSEDEDNKVLDFIRSRIPTPAINVCYMILSEQCNLACKYCFLGNNDMEKRKQFNLESMSFETAEKAVTFFIKQYKQANLDAEQEKPIIIFYGGEPLVNYKVLVFIAQKMRLLQNEEPCLKNLEMSMVSNGLLLDDEKIETLKELGVNVAISVDGFTERENSMRVDCNSQPTFSKVLDKIRLCKEHNLPISLSVTLSEETIKSKRHIIDLLKEYDIQSLGFNIMMSSDTFVVPDSYNDAAAQYIIEQFVELRKMGIYEDRIMRKLDAFSKAQVYYSDCAATCGGQIVIAPNGQVGICHGCLYDKKYFVTDIYDDTFDCKSNTSFIEWSQITPVNRDECLDCPALGICGGGCPINAMYLKPGNTIHSIDTRFCSHAQKTLDFFIRDLYRVILERNSSNAK